MTRQAVHVTASPAIQVKLLIESKGLKIGTCIGDSFLGGSPLPLEPLGILRAGATPRISRTQYLFGLIKGDRALPPKDKLIGVVWFSNAARQAQGGKWAVSIYGRNNVALLKSITNEMRTKFGAEIILGVENEKEMGAFRFVDWQYEPCPYS